MNVRRVFRWCVVTGFVALSAGWGLDKGWGAPLRQPPALEEGMQVLTRGPVHEAFAGTITFDPEPGLVVSERPPEAIEELPPDQRLEGDNVTWIPGYWAWDEERSDFLWVSGIWRNLPPDRQWVPGYWGRTGPDFQWISGYWADVQVSEIEYLPEPPATVESGPNIAAPSADQIWLPGNWVWHQTRYAWRPGSWSRAQSDWVWIPAHYVYTPRGYIFVEGYWDYPVARRGVLFAPVYFSSRTYARRGFSYSPTTVISLGAFVDHLFMRPRYQHYYFGDYYAANYYNAGYYPSYSVHSSRYGYDPIFAHQRWQHRQDGAWEQRVAATYQHRRDHAEARPPRIWTSQGISGAAGVASAVRNLMGASLDQASQSREHAWRFQAIDQAERQRLGQHRQQVQRFRDQRQLWETQTAEAEATDPVRRGQPARMKLPTSPIAARSLPHRDSDYTPPKTHAAPPLDTSVRPQPRVSRSPEQPPRHTTLRPSLDMPQPEAEQPEERRGQPPQPEAEQPEERRGQPPQPKVEQPEERRGQPPQPKMEQPEERRGQPPQPKAEQPEERRGQPPQPKMEQPEERRGQPPQPKAEQPEERRGQPPQPKMEQPEERRGQPPQPKAEQPEERRGQPPQPKMEQPEERRGQPPQPKVEQPEDRRGQPPQPKAEQPEERRGQPPQPKAEQPEERRGHPPQPRAERPEERRGQAPQPKAERPEQRRGQPPQPKAERPDPQSRDRKPERAPEAEPKPDEDRSPSKGKGKGKGKG